MDTQREHTVGQGRGACNCARLPPAALRKPPRTQLPLPLQSSHVSKNSVQVALPGRLGTTTLSSLTWEMPWHPVFRKLGACDPGRASLVCTLTLLRVSGASRVGLRLPYVSGDDQAAQLVDDEHVKRGRNLRVPLHFRLRYQDSCRVGTGESGLVFCGEMKLSLPLELFTR